MGMVSRLGALMITAFEAAKEALAWIVRQPHDLPGHAEIVKLLESVVEPVPEKQVLIMYCCKECGYLTAIWKAAPEKSIICITCGNALEEYDAMDGIL